MLACVPCSASNDTGQSPLALTLAAAEMLLLHQNHDLIASRRALAGAQADRVTAGQRPNPTLSVSTLSIDPRRVGAGSAWEKSMDTAAQISQSIERGGKRDLRSAAASHNVLAGSSDVDEIQQQQGLLLRQTYIDVHLAQERVSISGETALAFRRTLDAIAMCGCNSKAEPQQPEKPVAEGDHIVFPRDSKQLAALISVAAEPEAGQSIIVPGRIGARCDKRQTSLPFPYGPGAPQAHSCRCAGLYRHAQRGGCERSNG